ncbi:MAG: N(4)-(beta-N-acetylglucosaminyl)-L-asparaginase [Oligoflexales bacterium]
MQGSRRDFLKNAGCLSLGLPLVAAACGSDGKGRRIEMGGKGYPLRDGEAPIVMTTWGSSKPAADLATKLLAEGMAGIDVVEKAIVVVEDDPAIGLTGLGGLPDSSGEVTLDASIMDHEGNCGSVGGLRGIRNPIKVARLVKERTKHVFLVGDKASEFAVENGLKTEDLLTEKARQAYKKWKDTQVVEGKLISDTLGLIVLDTKGNLAGGCSTSGTAYKIPGRIGDSPIIGPGLFVEQGIGCAVATGLGEEIIKVVGSFAVVENMRRGMEPNEAIADVLARIVKRSKDAKSFQACFMAIRQDGMTGAMGLSASISPFVYHEARKIDGIMQRKEHKSRAYLT